MVVGPGSGALAAWVVVVVGHENQFFLGWVDSVSSCGALLGADIATPAAVLELELPAALIRSTVRSSAISTLVGGACPTVCERHLRWIKASVRFRFTVGISARLVCAEISRTDRSVGHA